MNDESQLISVSDQQLATELDWHKSTKVAEFCKAIVEATAINLGGKRYIPIEGWQSIAAAWGCTPSTEEPQRTEDGYRVKALLKRDMDGMILSTAYGFVGDDEPLWAKRTRHANEGMAQTRAMSRVCANKFRFIPVLMKIENLATTPFEEMPGVDDHPSHSRNPEPPQARRKPVEPEPPRSNSEPTNGNSSALVGVVSGCRKSTFEGRDYYWAQIADKPVFTSQEQLGQKLFGAADQMVEALVKPARKAGRWIIEDFHYAQE
jgi:hypothetical protein